MVLGKCPLFLEQTTADSLLLALFGSDQNLETLEMGADQCIIVRNEEVQKRLEKTIPNALILTVLESKGLEFDDVCWFIIGLPT